MKGSLLFLEKFTEKEQKRFDQTEAKARKEIEEKHAPEMDQKRAQIENVVRTVLCAAGNSDPAQGTVRTTLKKELAAYEKDMAAKIADTRWEDGLPARRVRHPAGCSEHRGW